MRIDQDLKLDYKDVLIRPKRSTLSSRKEVSLERDFTFRNYVPDFPDNVTDYQYRGVPIMAANMDGVGTFAMADKLAEGGGEVITKYYLTNELEPIQKMSGIDMMREFPKVEEKQFVQFYGMSSDAANTKHFGGLKDYRSSEGREVLVPYRGKVSRTIQDLLGGIRSTCTYAGANSLKQLSKCTTFVRCTQQFNTMYASK